MPETSKHTLAKWPLVMSPAKAISKSVTIVANGSLLPEAIKAADILESKGVGAFVLHASNVNHPDLKTVRDCLKQSGGRLVTVEDHRITGGMGALLTHALCLAGETLQVKSLGVGDSFGQSAYSALELYKKHGLDSTAIAKAATELANAR